MVVKNSILTSLIIIIIYVALHPRLPDDSEDVLGDISEDDEAAFDNKKRILQMKKTCTRIIRDVKVK